MIRLVEHGDAEAIFNSVDENREYLREWLPWVDGTKAVGDIENFITRSLHDYADRKSATFVITEDSGFCGVCGFNKFDFFCGYGDIGYWIDQKLQGRGIMSAAVGELLVYAFSNLGLELCNIVAAVENKKSRAVAERAGFTCTGTQRRAENLNGRVVDHALYSITKAEWQESGS